MTQPAPAPPRLANRRGLWGYLAEAAQHLLNERQARYPSLLSAGKISAEAAAIGIERAEAVARQWQWVVDTASPPLPAWDERTDVFGVMNRELADEMAAAALRARRLADKARGEWNAGELADLYEALAWWQRSHAGAALIVHHVDVERSAGRERAA